MGSPATEPVHVVVLAAGEGTRMRSSRPKVLQTVGGRPMLRHVLDAASRLGPDRTHVVYGVGADAVRAAVPDDDIAWVLQPERLGTGHAVQQAMPDIPDSARVLVLNGDHPLVTPGTLARLLEAPPEALAVLTMTPDDPHGYGRILRDASGNVTGIVEEKDADEVQRAIGEVNSGVVLAPAAALRGWLERLRPDNRQGELYLTDIFALAVEDGVPVVGIRADDATELLGANDRGQLAALERVFQRRAVDALMAEGVQVMDPARLDIRGAVEAGSDVRIDANVVLAGANRLGDGVEIGFGAHVTDCDLHAGTRVHPYSVLEGVRTTGACDIGPFARMRPGSELSEGCRVGNFVEVKNATFGAGSKAGHLAYLGDAEIGRNVNIGAGVITCNYDGANKHRTEIGDGAFIGSDAQLVAPVRVGENATIGAGTTVTRPAPPDELTVSRARQTTVRGWKRPEKKK